MPLIAITREMGSLGIEVAEHVAAETIIGRNDQIGAARAWSDARGADFG